MLKNCKLFACLNIMRKYRRSFSLTELAIYMAVMSTIVVITLGGMSVVRNARVQRVIEELHFYENAISDFVIKYGELPGNMSNERCLMFNEFKNFCQVLSSDNPAKTTTLNTQPLSYVAINNDNLAEQVVGLNYGRFLKTSGIVESVKFGLDKELEITNLKDGKIKNYLPKVGIGDEVYMHYTYNNTTNRWNDGLIFNDIFDEKEKKFSNIGMNVFSFSDNTDNAVILIFSTLGRYIDIEKGGAFSADFMEKIDKKIDDGRPRTGFLVGLPQGTDGQKDVANTCDDNTEYFDNQDERILEVKYRKETDNKYGCNLAYLSTINFEEMLANQKYFG